MSWIDHTKHSQSRIEIDGKPVHTTVFIVTGRPYTVDGTYPWLLFASAQERSQVSEASEGLGF